jgi:carboxyl-terminal processing protease
MGTNRSNAPGSVRKKSGARTLTIRHAIAYGIGVAALTVAACSGGERELPPLEQANSERMLQIGLSDIQQIYIDEPVVGDLAVAGLRGLSKIDPEMRIERHAGLLEIRLGRGIAGSTRAPDGNDALAWAIAVSKLLHDGRRGSAKLGRANPEKIYKAVFEGVARKLDPYSRYASAEKAYENRASRDGFGGIGVVVAPHLEGAEITDVIDDTPAQRMGLRRGEWITSINDQKVAGMSLHRIVRLLQGPVGRQVSLAVRRNIKAPPRKVQLQRAHITPQTVFYRRDGNLARIEIASFNSDTTLSVERMTMRAQREIGAQLRGIVIDLRDNPGGLLHQAVRVADLFIESGRLISTRGRHRDSLQLFDATPGDIAHGLPIAVLVNGSSASAAEILAAALQDRGRAIVVGSTSYGKGTVQTVLRMPNEGELILTWARLYAPSGYSLSKAGVIPNVCTANSTDAQLLVRDALKNNGAMSRQMLSIRRKLDTASKVEREALKNYCPRGGDGRNLLDSEVAKLLLTVQKRYVQTLKLASKVYASR